MERTYTFWGRNCNDKKGQRFSMKMKLTVSLFSEMDGWIQIDSSSSSLIFIGTRMLMLMTIIFMIIISTYNYWLLIIVGTIYLLKESWLYKFELLCKRIHTLEQKITGVRGKMVLKLSVKSPSLSPLASCNQIISTQKSQCAKENRGATRSHQFFKGNPYKRYRDKNKYYKYKYLATVSPDYIMLYLAYFNTILINLCQNKRFVPLFC